LGGASPGRVGKGGAALATSMPPKRRSYSDDWQTPPEAVEPLVPFLKARGVRVVWEPAAGAGLLAGALERHGFRVIATDVAYDPRQDFLRYEPGEPWDAIVTNPPYSLRYEFIRRAYELGRPWAMLMTLTTLEGRRQELFREHGVELLLLDRRVNFILPGSDGRSGAWFPVAWFCWRLLPRQIVFGSIPGAPRGRKQAG